MGSKAVVKPFDKHFSQNQLLGSEIVFKKSSRTMLFLLRTLVIGCFRDVI